MYNCNCNKETVAETWQTEWEFLLKRGVNKMYDYSKLCGRIIEVCGSRRKFADAMGMSTTALNNKLHNRKAWTQREIQKCCDTLGIGIRDIPVYFFTA